MGPVAASGAIGDTVTVLGSIEAPGVETTDGGLVLSS